MKKSLLCCLAIVGTSVAALANQLSPVMDTDTPKAEFNPTASQVVDHKTGLTWQRCLVGQHYLNNQCSGSATLAQSWEEALAIAQQAGNDWRLPTIKELSSIADNSRVQPALNTDVFRFTNQLSYPVQDRWDRDHQNPALWSATPVITAKGSSFYRSYAWDIAQGISMPVKRDDGKAYQLKAQYVLLVKNSQ